MFSKIKFLVIGFALATPSTTAWGENNKKSVINLISTCTAINNFIDVEPLGPSPGDIYVFVDELFTPDGSQKVGEVNGRCNLIDPAKASLGCTYVSVFSNGTLTMEGILYNVPDVVSDFAVTGGTGHYRGENGEGNVDVGSPCGPHKIRVTLSK